MLLFPEMIKTCAKQAMSSFFNATVSIIAEFGKQVSGECFKNIYELLNLRALKFSTLQKIASFSAWVRYFVWNFKGTLWNSTQNILPIHRKTSNFRIQLKWKCYHFDKISSPWSLPGLQAVILTTSSVVDLSVTIISSTCRLFHYSVTFG